jgi:hypothetical protein
MYVCRKFQLLWMSPSRDMVAFVPPFWELVTYRTFRVKIFPHKVKAPTNLNADPNSRNDALQSVIHGFSFDFWQNYCNGLQKFLVIFLNIRTSSYWKKNFLEFFFYIAKSHCRTQLIILNKILFDWTSLVWHFFRKIRSKGWIVPFFPVFRCSSRYSFWREMFEESVNIRACSW